MPGVKISDLTPSPDNKIDIGDAIPMARSGTTYQVPGGAFINTVTNATSQGTSLVKSQTYASNTGYNTQVKTLSANSPIVLTDSGNTISYDLPYDSSLTVTNGQLGINFSTGGGLELGAGGVKLATQSAPAAVIAVRPSDTSSPAGAATDDQWVTRVKVTTGNDQDTLQPYFKTFTGAANYANNNFSSNCTIYIDENTIEGTPSPNGQSQLAGNFGNQLTGQFFTQAQVDAAFGAGSGLLAGIYCFNNQYNVANSPYSGFPWGTSLYTQGATNVFARYYRSSINQWKTERYYNEAPRRISRRHYHDTSAVLTPPTYNGTTGVWSGGNLGTNANNWLKFLPDNYPTGRGAYQGVRSFNFNTPNASVYNICFEVITNGADCTAIEFNSQAGISFRNCTVAVGGSGCFNWGFLNIDQKARVYASGSPLRDPGSTNDSSPVMSFPGYGFVLYGINTVTPSNVGHGVKLDNDGGSAFFSNWSYDAFVYTTGGGSGLQGNLILAGKINLPYGVFSVSRSNQLTTGGIVLQDNLTISTSALDQSSALGYSNNKQNIPAIILDQTAQVAQISDYISNWTYHINKGPSVTSYTQPSIFYPCTLWCSTTANNTALNSAVVNGGIVTYNSNVVNSSNISIPTYAQQPARSSVANLGTARGGSAPYAGNTFLNLTDLYTLTSPYNNTAYTKPTYY
jgi:hypothetical protein